MDRGFVTPLPELDSSGI